MMRIPLAALVSVLITAAVPAQSGPPRLTGQRLVGIAVTPNPIILDRPQARQRVLVTGRFADGSQVDLTRDASLRLRDVSTASLMEGGTIRPVRDGDTALEVRVRRPGTAPLRAYTPVQIRNSEGRYRWDFRLHIAPVLARAGCSGTSCHGAKAGRGGFRLSAFGSDPETDHESIVFGASRRRIDLRRPAHSLILLKPTMTLPHAGGRRFQVGSPEYERLAAWLADGAPYTEGAARPPQQVVQLELLPAIRMLRSSVESQNLLVMAHFADGTREDVTALAACESRGEDAVKLDGASAVATGLGETTLLARYGGLSASARFGASTLPAVAVWPEVDPTSVIDREIFGRLKRLGVRPAPLASDEEWLRRVTLDLVGRIPTVSEQSQFVEEPASDRRERWVDALLASDEFARHWADTLNILLMGRNAVPAAADWAAKLEGWLREDRGWDAMARELLLARAGTETPPPDAAHLRFLESRFAQGDTGLDTVTRDVSRIFFGVDVQCARCHAHPEVAQWQQDVYWGVAAFFGRTYRLQVANRSYLAERALGEVEYFGYDQERRSARPAFLTGERPTEPAATVAAVPAPPGTPPPDPVELYQVPPEATKEKTRIPRPHYSRRERFVSMAIGPNAYFRRAMANRIWSILMGRGLVEPVEQMHAGNPASHPELLEELSVRFASRGFRLKALIRGIVTSRVYALSSRWEKGPAPAAELYAVAATRPQSLTQLANSTLVALGYWDGIAARVQAQAKPSPSAASSAQTVDPKLSFKVRSLFDSELSKQSLELRKRLDGGTDLFMPAVPQALYLSNSQAFQELIRKGGLAERLAVIPDPANVVREAYRSVLSRDASGDEVKELSGFAARRGSKGKETTTQMIWALVTSAEFRFIH
jgi:hypothetical protein